MWMQVMQMMSQMLFMVLSVVNSGSFPKPLTARQEQEALAAMAAGDGDARRRLIEHNLRLVAHIIKKHYAHARDQEDLISIGTVGLIKAVDTFDVTKGSRLATYASRCIENEIRMHFRSVKKTERDVSLSEPIDTDSEGHPLTLMDVLAVEESLPEEVELRENLKVLGGYVESLPPREREIVCLRYGLGCPALTQWQVAERLGISRSYVSRLETRALGLLHRRYQRK